MIPLNYEPTIANIKAACKRFFKAKDMECDILASKRGPSWTETSQISNWKTLHVQFIESTDQRNKIRTYSSAAIQTNVNKNCRLSSTKCHAKGRKVHSANI